MKGDTILGQCTTVLLNTVTLDNVNVNTFSLTKVTEGEVVYHKVNY